jgi:hypothetical protein
MNDIIVMVGQQHLDTEAVREQGYRARLRKRERWHALGYGPRDGPLVRWQRSWAGMRTLSATVWKKIPAS